MKTKARGNLLNLAVFILMLFCSGRSLAATMDMAVNRDSNNVPAPTQNTSNQNYTPTRPNTNTINTNVYTNQIYITPDLNNVNTIPTTVQSYPGTANIAMPNAINANSLSSWGSTYASGNYGYSQANNIIDYTTEPINNTPIIPPPKIDNSNNITISPDTNINTAQYPINTTAASVDIPKPEKIAPEKSPRGVIKNIPASVSYTQSMDAPVVIPAYKYSDNIDVNSNIDKNIPEDKIDDYKVPKTDFKSQETKQNDFNNLREARPYIAQPE